MKKRFKEVTVMGMATFQCPDCLWIFGITNKYLDTVGDVNIHITCPYCGKEHGIEKND